MKINEVEAAVGVTKKNIRFYEEEGLITPSREPGNGYRSYSQADVERLRRIKLLRKLDVPLAEIREMLEGQKTLAEGMAQQLERLSTRRKDLDEAKALDLLRRAAIAMQDAAQQSGRLELYQEGRDAAHQRQINLVRDLRHAAERGELILYYQPKLDIPGRRVHEAECLLRWNHPHYGMVSPGEFIPLAERTGSIQLLTTWVIGEALRQLHEWNGHGLVMQVSLNISAEDLVDLQLAERVQRQLAEQGVAAEQLVFEITESAMMRDQQRALDVLLRLRACGIQLSVDDFGTGYSSLAYLSRLRFDCIKIDQDRKSTRLNSSH